MAAPVHRSCWAGAHVRRGTQAAGVRPPLRAIAFDQRGLVTRRQCVAAGYRLPELRVLLAAGGLWLPVRRGVYVERWAWEALSTAEKRQLRDYAVHLSMTTDHVMSHDSAARALGVPMLRPRLDLTHVTREGVRGSRTEHGVRHHLTRFDVGEVVTEGGMAVTGPARTALDLAREHGRDAGVVAVDHVLRHGTSRLQLQRELEVMWSWPHVRQARLAVELGDGRAETPIESLLRMLVVDAGFEDIDVQWPVIAGGVVRWSDLRVGNHLFEADGLLKLLTPADGGIATSTRTALRDERRRQTEVCAVGLGMSRVMWDDHFGRARARTIERLRAEEAVTRQRFGPTLPAHLAEQAARIRRDHPRPGPPDAGLI